MAMKASEGTFKTPEQLLEELGISDPAQLNIEAIAFHCDALITYEPLSGCEANIIGKGNNAIITVNSRSVRAKQRFSAGHELGHWMRDRGQAAFGCTSKQIEGEWASVNAEARANQFASDLLLPSKLFDPLTKRRPVTLDTVRDLATAFRMSLTATAIKLVRCGSYPSMLVYFEAGRRKWFIPAEGLPKRLFPAGAPHEHSVIGSLLSKGLTQSAAEDIRADTWFDIDGAERYYVRESAFRVADDSAFALIWWEEEQQIIDLEDEEDRRFARRSDWRPDE
jgi:hypothetical protein